MIYAHPKYFRCYIKNSCLKGREQNGNLPYNLYIYTIDKNL